MSIASKAVKKLRKPGYGNLMKNGSDLNLRDEIHDVYNTFTGSAFVNVTDAPWKEQIQRQRRRSGSGSISGSGKDLYTEFNSNIYDKPFEKRENITQGYNTAYKPNFELVGDPYYKRQTVRPPRSNKITNSSAVKDAKIAKSNNPLNRIVSNLVPNVDEILGNARGMHQRNIHFNESILKDSNAIIEAGIGSKQTISDAATRSSLAKNNIANSSSFIDNKELLDTIVDGDVNNAKGIYRDQRKRILEGNGIKQNSMLNKVTDINNYFLGDGVSSEAKRARLGVLGTGIGASAIGLGIGAKYASNKRKEKY